MQGYIGGSSICSQFFQRVGRQFGHAVEQINGSQAGFVSQLFHPSYKGGNTDAAADPDLTFGGIIEREAGMGAL